MLVIGDPASLPAINSLLAVAEAAGHDLVRDLARRRPLAAVPDRPRAARAPCDSTGGTGRERQTDLPKLLGEASDAYVWIACDTATTRALTTYVLKELAVPKHRVKALGYWKAA
nr:SIP domain-containing protein [Kribbella pittospori]